jgi:hypothetical protein
LFAGELVAWHSITTAVGLENRFLQRKTIDSEEGDLPLHNAIRTESASTRLVAASTAGSAELPMSRPLPLEQEAPSYEKDDQAVWQLALEQLLAELDR